MQSHQNKYLTISEEVNSAIRTRQLSELQKFITSENIEAVDQYGYTALALAITFGDIPTIEWLIQKGANLHFVTKSKEGALSLAARYDLNKVKCLIKHGLSVDQGKSPPSFSAPKYPLVIFKIISSKDKNKPFLLSVKKRLSVNSALSNIYEGKVSPNVSVNFSDELSDVSLKIENNGTLVIENLSDNINYVFKTAGDIKTNNQNLQLKNANLRLGCNMFKNQRGKIDVKNFELNCKAVNNSHGDINAAKIHVLTKEGILNLHGQILATSDDVTIHSQLKKDKKLSKIKSLNGGRIIAEQGKVIINANKIITDDESRVWGLKGVDFNANKLQHESTLNGEEKVNLVIAEKSDINASIVADEVEIDQKKGILNVTHTIIANKRRNFKLQNPFSLVYDHKKLRSKSDLEFEFDEGGDLNKPLYNYASVRIKINHTAVRSLKINNHIVNESKENKYAEINISTPTPLLFGNKKNQIQLRALTGNVFLKASRIEIPFSVIISKFHATFIANNGILIGDINQPTKTSDLRSESIAFNAGTKLKTYHTAMRVGNLSVSAKEDWDDVANQIYVRGIANLAIPKSTHRILTGTVVENGYITDFGSNHFGRFNDKLTKTFARSAPPSFMASELITTGSTEVVGGSFTTAKHTTGAPPILTHFIETTIETGDILCGHKKQRKCKLYPHNITHYNKKFLASSSVGNSEYKQTELALPGNYRANQLIISGFNKLIIGDSANTRIVPVKSFRQIIDVLDETNIPNSSLCTGIKNPYSIFTDPFELSPKLPTLPRVIIQSNGIKMMVEQKAIFPLSIEEEKVALAFIKNIGQLPPEFNFQSLDLERLHAELLQNTLDFFALKDQSNQPPVSLIKHQLSLEKITNPLLVYQEIDYPQKDGSIVRGVKPVLVCPKSYKKYLLTAGTTLIANILKLIGNTNSQLHITGEVHGNKLIDVDVGDCLVETRLYTEKQLISQNTSKRKYGRKKTECMEQIVTIAQLRERASLICEGTLNITADKMIQRGSHIAGDQGLLSVKQYQAEPILESHIVPYSDQGKICGGIVNKTKVWGEVLHSSLVPSSISFGSSMKLRAEVGKFSAYQVMSLVGNVDMAFTQGVKLKIFKLSQPMIPIISKSGRILTIGSGTIEQGFCNIVTAFTDSILISSQGYYQSEATQYSANELIRLTAKSMAEMAIPLSRSYHTESSGFKGFSYLNEQTHQYAESALAPRYVTGPQGKVEITATETVEIQAPEIQTSNLHIKAKDIKLLALSLRFFYEATRHSATLNFMGASAIQALAQGNFKKAYQSFLNEFPVLASGKDLLKSKDLADLSMHGTKTFYHAYQMFQAYQDAKSFDEFLESQFDLSPKVRFGCSTESSSQTKAIVPHLVTDNTLFEAENVDTEGLQAEYSRLFQIEATNIAMKPAQESKNYESSDDGFSVGMSMNTFTPNMGVDAATHRFDGSYHIPTRLTGPVTELRASNNLEFAGVIQGDRATISGKDTKLYTLQDYESSNSSSFIFSSSLEGHYSKGSSNKRWTNTQTEIHMQDALEIESEELSLKGVKLSSISTPAIIRTQQLFQQDVYDYDISKQFNVGFNASGLINKKSDFLGYVSPEFRRETHRQINRTFVQGEAEITSLQGDTLQRNVTDNKVVSSTKKHMGIFLPVKNISSNPSPASNGESNLNDIILDDLFLSEPTQVVSVLPEVSLELAIDLHQKNDVLDNETLPSVLAEPKRRGLLPDFLNDIPLLEPAIHTFEHAVVPSLHPSKQLRIGAILKAAQLKKDLTSITVSQKFIPDDPLKIFSTKNLIRAQKGIHVLEWGIGTFESYHHNHHHGLSTANALIVSALSSGATISTNALLSNTFFHSHRPMQLSGKYLAKSFGKSILTSAVATSVMEFVPNYFNLRSQNYSMGNSLVSSFLGATVAVTTGTAGLWLIKTSLPMISSGVGTAWGCAQFGVGTALVLRSSYVGTRVTEGAVKLSESSKGYAENSMPLYEAFDFKYNQIFPCNNKVQVKVTETSSACLNNARIAVDNSFHGKITTKKVFTILATPLFAPFRPSPVINDLQGNTIPFERNMEVNTNLLEHSNYSSDYYSRLDRSHAALRSYNLFKVFNGLDQSPREEERIRIFLPAATR